MLQDMVTKHLSGLVLTASVAAVSAYVLWGDSVKTWKRGKLRPSLDNLGNTCFLNCITQSLASIDMFYLWLQDTLSQQIQSESSDSEAVVVEVTPSIRSQYPMISALYEVLTVLRKSTDGSQSTSLSKVHSAMADHGWGTLFAQEDAYEAFQVLIEALENEAKQINKSFTSSPVQGKYIVSFECTECHNESTKQIEAFDCINLYPTNNNNSLHNSLNSLLTTHFATQTVNEVECETCTEELGFTKKCDFIKHIHIARAPQCLTIQISRTTWEDGIMSKNNQHVSFPVNTLDLTLFAYKSLLFEETSDHNTIEQETAVSREVEGFEVVRTYSIKEDKSPCRLDSLVYNLKAVIVHYGGPNSGHYLTYRKLDGERWMFASDDMVRLSQQSEVCRQQAYLLFYEKESVRDSLLQSTE